MSNKPLITIVTVTYNAEEFLERTIKSVIEQDYKNIEYIIIDGGSTYETLDIIKKYEKHINYWVSEKDEGIYDAMNKGTSIASGEYINYLNAGDIFSSIDTVSTIVSNISIDIDVIYGGANLWYEKFDKLVYDAPRSPESIVHKLPCVHQTMFIKLLFMKNNLYNINYKLSSDVELFFELVKQNKKFKIIDQSIVNFLMGGISQYDKVKSHIEVLEIASKYISDGNELYAHASYLALQSNNPYKNESDNFSFSIMFNNIIKQIEELNIKYENIIIYGNSHIGKYIKYILNQKKKNVMVLDRNYNGVNTFSPEILTKIEFDIVIIAVLGREESIIQYLVDELSLEKNKIITLSL